MIGTETLWENLLLYKDLQSRNLHLLLDNVRQAAKQTENSHVFLNAHIASFHSKLLLSTVLSDQSAGHEVREITSNIWLKAHGFTRTFDITWKNYVELIHRHDLALHLKNTLIYSPAALCCFIVRGVFRTFRDDTQLKVCISVLLVVTTVATDRLRQEEEWSGNIIPDIVSFISKYVSQLSHYDINILMDLYFRTSHFVFFTGCKTFKVGNSNFCLLPDSLPREPLPHFDDNIWYCLHTQLELNCCSYHCEDSTSTSAHSKLLAVQKSLEMFVDTVIVNSITLDNFISIARFVAVATYLLRNDGLPRLYDGEFTTSLDKKLGSVPENFKDKIKYTSIFKSLNFDAVTASWKELINQIKYGLEDSKESFKTIMDMKASLSNDKIHDVVGITDMLDPNELAIVFNQFIEISNVNEKLLKKVTSLLSGKHNCSLLTSFIVSLYSNHKLNRSCLSWVSPELKESIMGVNNTITKTVNQLAMTGTTSSRISVTKSLLLHFLLDPNETIETIFRLGSQNKALCFPLAEIIQHHLPFLLSCSDTSFDLNMSCNEIQTALALPTIVFNTLRQVLVDIRLIRDVKLFAQFITGLSPDLGTNTIVKQILIPGLKDARYSGILVLNLLQHILQCSPFFNLSVFLAVLKLWSDRSNEKLIGFIDDNEILEALLKNLKYEPERQFLRMVVEELFEFHVKLRIQSIDEKLVVVHVDESLSLLIPDSLNTPCRRLQDVFMYIPVVIMNKSDPQSFSMNLLHSELLNLKVCSNREWERSIKFLDQSLQSGYIDLPCFLEDVSKFVPDLPTDSYSRKDSQTIIFCAIFQNNLGLIPWYAFFKKNVKAPAINKVDGKDKTVTTATSSCDSLSLERFFLQCCILIKKFEGYKMLETLIMTTTSAIKHTATFKVGLNMLPLELKNTLCNSGNLDD